MGQTCSSACSHAEPDVLELSRTDSPDPLMFDLMRKSIQASTRIPSENNNTSSSSSNHYKVGKRRPPGQHHLLYRNSMIETLSGPVSSGRGNTPFDPNIAATAKKTATSNTESSKKPALWLPVDTPVYCPTRLLTRRRSLRVVDDGGETHIYAIRYPEDTPDKIISEQAAPRPESARQEQCPPKKMAVSSTPASTTATSNDSVPSKSKSRTSSNTAAAKSASASKSQGGAAAGPLMEGAEIFSKAAMASRPRQEVMDWVTVSEDHHIYIVDVGITAMQCDHVANTTEQVCRGQYAAYTYAKQTLGCREYPILAQASFSPVHTATYDIIRRLGAGKPEQHLQLDDREPHIVKYDVTKKERQKLDMHTDKSEWTFLIALSNGCGVDYEGGGTYFECLDATVHIQRGHALVFPGKLRHCGQKITSGLRFLLVGFLVDKSSNSSNGNADAAKTATTGATPVSSNVPDKE